MLLSAIYVFTYLFNDQYVNNALKIEKLVKSVKKSKNLLTLWIEPGNNLLV